LESLIVSGLGGYRMTTDYEPNLVLSNTRLPLGRSSRWRRRKKDRASYWSKSLVTFCQKQSNFPKEMRKLLRFRVRGGDGGELNSAWNTGWRCWWWLVG